MSIKMQLKIHMVAYLRGNKIEEVVLMTKSQDRAQHAVLMELKKAAPDLVDEVFRLFADEELTDNAHILVKEDEDGEGPLHLQMFYWIENIG